MAQNKLRTLGKSKKLDRRRLIEQQRSDPNGNIRKHFKKHGYSLISAAMFSFFMGIFALAEYSAHGSISFRSGAASGTSAIIILLVFFGSGLVFAYYAFKDVKRDSI